MTVQSPMPTHRAPPANGLVTHKLKNYFAAHGVEKSVLPSCPMRIRSIRYLLILLFFALFFTFARADIVVKPDP